MLRSMLSDEPQDETSVIDKMHARYHCLSSDDL